MHFRKSTISAIIILVSLATIVVMSGLNFLFKTQNYADNKQRGAENISVDQRTHQRLSASMNKIFFTTKDNIKIAANLYEVENPIGWLVLVHMMPATKESFNELAQRFQNLGYESMAIDLRGHGESTTQTNADGTQTNAEILDYRTFSDEDHQKSILDLEAAVDYLIKNRKATPDKISFIGASIGANLSLQYISEHPEFKTAILLSPGLNYRGIKTEPLVKNLKAGQKVFFVSATDDFNNKNNSEENKRLHSLVPEGVGKDIKIYQSGGHGTDILKNQPELINLILEFIQS